MKLEGGSVMQRLVEQAVRLGADSLEVEYKDQHKEVSAMKGRIGIGIASFHSSSPEAAALRGELYDLAEHAGFLLVSGVKYEIRCTTFESFGEDAFEVHLRRT